jgi:hypothetical protein
MDEGFAFMLKNSSGMFRLAEIEDTLHFAKSSLGWSVYISALQVDFERFKKDIKHACNHVKKMQGMKKRKNENA